MRRDPSRKLSHSSFFAPSRINWLDETGAVVGRGKQRRVKAALLRRDSTVTPAMTISRLAQRVSPLGLTRRHSRPSRFQPGRELQLRMTRSVETGTGSTTTTTAADAACGSGSGEVNTSEADFRRPASAGTGSAAPRRPTLRGAPSVFSPTLVRGGSHTNGFLRQHHHRPPADSRRAFSSSAPAMAAAKIDGTAIARKVRERLHAEIAEKKTINPRFQPCLKIIQGALHVASRPGLINQYPSVTEANRHACCSG